MLSADGKTMFVPNSCIVIDKKELARLREAAVEPSKDEEAPKEEETAKSLFEKMKDQF